MTALPTRKLEAYRYADIDALESVWSDLAPPERVEIAAQQSLQQIWLPSGAAVDVRRAELVLEAGASAQLFALVNAPRYGRIELDVTLRDGADFQLDAAMIGGGEATLEIVTTVRHVEPNATSRQTVRSVLGGKAIGSYLGKIAVARGAQKSDAVQSVKAMLLNRGASANAKPELEIYADDVVCGHGSTAAEIDHDLLFYCRSRGIPLGEARALLIEAFIGEALEKIEHEPVREALAAIAHDWLRGAGANG